MDALLTAASLATAAIGTGCCLAGRHTGAPAVAGMAAMLVAMADTMLFGSVLLASWAWAAVLVVAGNAGLVALRLAGGRSPLHVLRTLHLTVMGILVLAMAEGHPAGHAVAHANQHAGHQVGAAPVLVVGLGVAVAYVVACGVQARRHAGALVQTELTTSALSTAAMAAMLL